MTEKKKRSPRSRKFFALTYNDPEGLKAKIIGSGAAQWAYCTHDKDVTEDGELKKIHTHIVLAYENPRSCNSVAAAIDTEPQFVEPISRGNERGALRYLIHADNPEKAQYPLDAIQRAGYNNSIWVASANEEENILQVLEIIETGNVRNYRDLIRKCTNAGCWAELRRGGYLFARALEEKLAEQAAEKAAAEKAAKKERLKQARKKAAQQTQN